MGHDVSVCVNRFRYLDVRLSSVPDYVVIQILGHELVAHQTGLGGEGEA